MRANASSSSAALTKALTATSLLSVLLFLLFCAGILASTAMVRNELAQRLGSQSRRLFLMGDAREAEKSYMALVPEVFAHVDYVDAAGTTLFALPAMEDSVSLPRALHRVLYGTITIDYSLQNRGGENGRMTFEYRRFAHLDLALKVSLLWLLLAIPLSVWLRRRFLADLEKEIETRRLTAIAQTTQMLAHDVRKPFSILKIALGMLAKAQDAAAVKNILGKVVPEVAKSMKHVDGMLADLLEIGGGSSELITEAASAESLVDAALADIFRIYPKSSVSMTYDFQHTTAVDVHVQKVARVFSNIVANAVQAMKGNGQIWFKTQDITRNSRRFVEFRIGNGGSVIPPENLSKLFEAFFTSGKKGGTGLGLAIAKKVVLAHGGTITCNSSVTAEQPQGQVEFVFSFPAADRAPAVALPKLPNHSSEVARELFGASTEIPSSDIDPLELALEAKIIALAKVRSRPIEVLVVDDEAIYRDALMASLMRTAGLAAAIQVTKANNGTEALAKISNSIDLVITDVEMGEDTNGFDLVKSLRSQAAYSRFICVNSNRIAGDDYKLAMDVGANVFIPKPLARTQVLKVLLQATGAAQH